MERRTGRALPLRGILVDGLLHHQMNNMIAIYEDEVHLHHTTTVPTNNNNLTCDWPLGGANGCGW